MSETFPTKYVFGYPFEGPLTEQQLEQNTQRKIKQLTDQKLKDRAQKEAQALRKQQEELFAAKLKIFEIDSVKNRLLMFDSSRPHSSTSATDAKARINININYIPA